MAQEPRGFRRLCGHLRNFRKEEATELGERSILSGDGVLLLARECGIWDRKVP